MFWDSQRLISTVNVGLFNIENLYNLSAFELYLNSKHCECGVKNIRNIPCPVKCPIHAINDAMT